MTEPTKLTGPERGTADAMRRDLSGVGRLDIENQLIVANVTIGEQAVQIEKLTFENKALTANVTALQVAANGALASHRLAKVLADEPLLMSAMLDLAWAIDRARAKHPEGCSYFALTTEVGEVGHAIATETEARVDAELLDVMVVAMRMRLGETDPALALAKPVEARALRSA